MSQFPYFLETLCLYFEIYVRTFILLTNFHTKANFHRQDYYHHYISLPSHNHAVISLHIPHTIMLSFYLPFLTQSCYHHLTTHSLHNHAISPPLFRWSCHYHFTSHSSHNHAIILSLPILYTIMHLSFHFSFLTYKDYIIPLLVPYTIMPI